MQLHLINRFGVQLGHVVLMSCVKQVKGMQVPLNFYMEDGHSAQVRLALQY